MRGKKKKKKKKEIFLFCLTKMWVKIKISQRRFEPEKEQVYLKAFIGRQL